MFTKKTNKSTIVEAINIKQKGGNKYGTNSIQHNYRRYQSAGFFFYTIFMVVLQAQKGKLFL